MARYSSLGSHKGRDEEIEVNDGLMLVVVEL